MKASRGTWLRLHHFAKVCIHGPRLLMVDSGHGEQACWIFETEYYYEFQLSLLPTYLPFPSPRMLLLHTNTSTLYE